MPSAIAHDLVELIEQQAFPCVGAKSALARHQIELMHAGDLRRRDRDSAITSRLQQAASRWSEQAMFVSLAITFEDTPALDEPDFEQALWKRLQSIQEHDARHHAWDGTVSDDPQSPHFAMSVGGRAFYVIGMHPAASRLARRFRCPVLVFNPHSQFRRLRADGRYARLKQAVRARDVAYSGSANPMLADHGTASEASQYSGRLVDADWTCPFHARHSEDAA